MGFSEEACANYRGRDPCRYRAPLEAEVCEKKKERKIYNAVSKHHSSETGGTSMKDEDIYFTLLPLDDYSREVQSYSYKSAMMRL